MTGKVSLLIINWNTKDDVVRCLDSVMKTISHEHEVIVVDNASSDGSADAIATQFPIVKLIRNSENVGFAKANMQAAELATGDWILLLNPDTVVSDSWLAGMLRFAEHHPRAGVIGPKLLNADGTLQPSIRRFPSFASQLMMMLKLHVFFRRKTTLSRYFADDVNYDVEQLVDQVSGACFLIRRSTWDALYGLDTGYWIWFEEVDFCKRVHERGEEVWYTPAVAITHTGGQAFSQAMNVSKQRWYQRSLIRYMSKFGKRWQVAVLWAVYPVGLAIAYCVGALSLRRKRYGY